MHRWLSQWRVRFSSSLLLCQFLALVPPDLWTSWCDITTYPRLGDRPAMSPHENKTTMWSWEVAVACPVTKLLCTHFCQSARSCLSEACQFKMSQVGYSGIIVLIFDLSHYWYISLLYYYTVKADTYLPLQFLIYVSTHSATSGLVGRAAPSTVQSRSVSLNPLINRSGALLQYLCSCIISFQLIAECIATVPRDCRITSTKVTPFEWVVLGSGWVSVPF